MHAVTLLPPPPLHSPAPPPAYHRIDCLSRWPEGEAILLKRGRRLGKRVRATGELGEEHKFVPPRQQSRQCAARNVVLWKLAEGPQTPPHLRPGMIAIIAGGQQVVQATHTAQYHLPGTGL